VFAVIIKISCSAQVVGILLFFSYGFPSVIAPAFSTFAFSAPLASLDHMR